MAGMHNMLMGSATSALISIEDDTIYIDYVGESALDFSYVLYSIQSNGVISFIGSSTVAGTYNGLTDGTNWVTPTGSASNYEVKATYQSGVTPTGTLNTWLSCTTDRTWQITQTGYGETISVILVEIRDAVTQVVRDSATITMHIRSGS